MGCLNKTIVFFSPAAIFALVHCFSEFPAEILLNMTKKQALSLTIAIALLVVACSGRKEIGSEQDRVLIRQSWSEYRNAHSITASERSQMLSPSMLDKFYRRFQNAVFMPKSELEQIEFQERVSILSLRNTLRTRNDLDSLLRLGADKLYTTVNDADLVAFNTSDLAEIVFENDALAYGVYAAFGVPKNVAFEKSGEKWLIDMEREMPQYALERKSRIAARIQTTGSEKSLIESINLGGINWEPLRANK